MSSPRVITADDMERLRVDRNNRHCVCQQRIDVSTLMEALAYVSQELRAVSTDNAELRNALAALTARVTEVERGARQ